MVHGDGQAVHEAPGQQQDSTCNKLYHVGNYISLHEVVYASDEKCKKGNEFYLKYEVSEKFIKED